MADFHIWSDEFAAGGYLSRTHEFDQPAFGVDGENLSPALQWDGVPPEAKSLALTLYDPDAPTGSGFWHWVLVNLPVDTRALPQNAGKADGSLLPVGALQLRNDYGTVGYGGMAPPRADKAHRFIFRIHAIRTDHLAVDPGSTHAIARFLVHQNEIDSATYTGLYQLK